MNIASRAIELKLKEFRDKVAKQNGIEFYKVLTNDTIEAIAREMPATNIELLSIKGIGPAKSKMYGSTILGIISSSKQELEVSHGGEIRSVSAATISLASDVVNFQGETAIEKKERIFTVSEFLDHFNQSFSRKPLAIHGEVYDSIDRKGANIYFKIKDRNEEATLACYMRASVEERLGIFLEEGAEVIISGFLGVYKPSGRFSLTVTEFMVHGEGLLKRAFEQLQRRLENEGFFSIERKRTLPQFIKKIGLITSKGSDAEKDFITHVVKRGISVERLDVRVEGLQSVDMVSRAITYFNSSGSDVDVIVVTRGGGSLDSLQSFNSEQVARALYGSRIPVVSAVGHEKDVTIADMVADVRASTPTHAGKIVSEGWLKAADESNKHQSLLYENSSRLLQLIDRTTINYKMSLDFSMNKCIEGLNSFLEREYRHLGKNAYSIFEQASFLKHRLITSGENIGKWIENNYVKTNSEFRQLTQLSSRLLQTTQLNLNTIEERISILNPIHILEKGYSILLKEGKGITSIKDININDSVEIILSDGKLKGIIESKNNL